MLVLPPLIWGWLTYRVMAFDALAGHASKPERQEIFKRHRLSLLAGILTGLLGAAPGIVWASGVVFAAAFFVLVPVAIWIYTLVFAFPRCGSRTVAWRRCSGCASRAVMRVPGPCRPTGHRHQRTLHWPLPVFRPTAPMTPTFSLIIVGDEILSGKRVDKHLAKVIELLARGVVLGYADYGATTARASPRRCSGPLLRPIWSSAAAVLEPRPTTTRASARRWRLASPSRCTPRQRR